MGGSRRAKMPCRTPPTKKEDEDEDEGGEGMSELGLFLELIAPHIPAAAARQYASAVVARASAEGCAWGSGAAATATSAPNGAVSLPGRVAALTLSVLGEVGAGGLALQIQAVEEALLGAKQNGALPARIAALKKALKR